MITDVDVVTGLRGRICSPQWSGFVQALGAEFESVLASDDLKLLMQRVGQRFAEQYPIPNAEDLSTAQQHMNQCWTHVHWGWCALSDQGASVQIEHALAPLSAALPDAAWSDGFLEGVYDAWMRQLGMLQGLAVRAAGSASSDVRRFVLKRVN